MNIGFGPVQFEKLKKLLSQAERDLLPSSFADIVISYFDSQHNNSQHNDSQHNGSQHNDSQHTDNQYYATNHDGSNCDALHKQHCIIISVAILLLC